MNLFDVEERDINKIDENLTTLDRWKLNRRYKALARKSKNSEVDNEEDKLLYEREKAQRNQTIDRLTDKEKELQKELSIKKRQARINRISNLQKAGAFQSHINTLYMIVSALTSMLGLGTACTGLGIQELIISWSLFQNLQYFFVGVLFFIAEYVAGWLFGQNDTRKEFFDNGTRLGNIMQAGTMTYILFIYITSVYSNGVFWYQLTNNKLVTLTYAFIFDIGGLILAYNSYKYLNLDSPKIQSESNQNVTQNEVTKIEVTTDGKGGYQETKIQKTRKNYQKALPKNYLKHRHVLEKLEDNQRVNKDTFKLDQYEWKILRQQFEKDNLVYCNAKSTYKKPNMITNDICEKR